MILEINLDFLKEKNLSIPEFSYLWLLYKKEFVYLEQICIKDGKILVDTKYLEDNNWIKINGETAEEVILREKALSLFQDKKSIRWQELCNTFPHKTSDGRVLRTFDPMAKSNEKAMLLYFKATKNGRKDLHDLILKGLNKELESRKKSNNLKFMNNLETWLRNSMWEKYIQDNTKEFKEERL